MWIYQKNLMYPVSITKKDLKFAKILVETIGGPYGELAAALRYLTQRYTMPTNEAKALLTDIGTEELGHVEILSTMMYQLLKGATIEEIKEAGLENNYIAHGHNFFLTDSNGITFDAKYIAVTGDYIADLTEDIAAEEKARAGYEHLMDLTDNEEILAPLAFLRQREIIHCQRFAEMLTILNEYKKNNQ